jgi:hypothetical protein
MSEADEKSIEEWRKCVEETLAVYGVNLALLNIGGAIKAVESRGQCDGLLTPAARERLYQSNKGWYELFEPGGPLDPRSHGYMDRI